MSKQFYKEVIVWSPIDNDKVRRYRIFEVLPDKKYFIKGFDLFYPSHEHNYFDTLDFQPFYVVFRDDFHSEIKEGLYDSIEEAIEQFEKDLD